ncbi:hypothetical protein [Cohnella thermotolerans]|uniref:hypothetical protein n=1 Tax=Cohnella thermotolerans TaxID=329858 RepID=UPI0004284710|nr:hypothetical protein [Cohnella thermotolerans]
MRAGRNRRREGSVSVYFIAVTAGFVLFTGLLIDFARIAAFRKQAELSVKSGARSVLSAFDPELYGRYGLFARGGDPADELFRRTLEGNVEPRDGDSFRPLDVEWSDAGVLESRPLGSHDVFRRQVLEEMKYKAPIDLSLELASRFKGLAPALQEAKASVDALEAMRQAYDKREAALDEALDNQRKAGKTLAEALDALVPSPPVSMTGAKTAGRANHLPDAALMYEDYVQKRESDARRAAEHSRAVQAWEQRKSQAEQEGREFSEPAPSGGSPQYAKQTSAYEKSVKEMGRQLQAKPDPSLAEAAEALMQAKERLAEAEDANRDMQRIAEEAEAESNGPGSSASAGEDVDPEASIGDDKADTVRQLRQSAKELVLEASFFAEYERELDEQGRGGEEKTAKAAELAPLLLSVPGSSGLSKELRSGIGELQSLEAEYRSKYGSGGTVIARREEAFAAHRSGDGERKRLESEADKEWSGASALLGAFTGRAGSDDDNKAFERLRSLAEENLKWNEAEAEKTEDAGLHSGPEAARDASMTQAGDWLHSLAEAAAGQRDSLYFAEYAAARFAHAEPSEVKAVLNGDGDEALDAAHQQLEYVLYGFGSPSGNLAAAYGEIFAFRLAIRTMEGLIECRKYGHPLVVLAAALLYAVQHAIADLNQLLAEGKIPLSRYAKADTYYIDYLRIFLLLHGDSSARIARSIAVMEAETGLSFQRTYTYVSGEGTASLGLWFFPGLTKVLGQAGNWGGVVRDGRYEVTCKAEDAYQ